MSEAARQGGCRCGKVRFEVTGTVPSGVPDFVNVRTTMFDAPLQEPPFVETYRAEGLPWAEAGARRSYDKLPAMDEWPVLMQEYAAGPAAMKEATS